MGFVDELAAWYDKYHRDLPWRNTKDPYQIWLSEIILQQTRVDQGMAYYYKFCELFPTVIDLANASQDEVLKAWQGLGYYSRARNLHATAQFIRDQHNGCFPTSYEGLIELKGIGPYTAAAIASFAFNESKPVVDGNVMRVITRNFGIFDPIDSNAGKKQVTTCVEELIQDADPALFNQAIMELGALCCTPKSPNCAQCPIRSSCVALEKNVIHELPVKAKKTKVKELYLHYAVVLHEGQVLMRKRTHSNIWKGLYDFPCMEKEESSPNDLQEMQRTWGFKNRSVEISQEYTHILSHRKIKAVFYRFESATTPDWQKEWQWVPIKEIELKGIPRLVDRYIQDTPFDPES